jgi:hypothetical protein
MPPPRLKDRQTSPCVRLAFSPKATFLDLRPLHCHALAELKREGFTPHHGILLTLKNALGPSQYGKAIPRRMHTNANQAKVQERSVISATWPRGLFLLLLTVKRFHEEEVGGMK